MSPSFWIDRLYDDESLTDNLTDAEAARILKWAESRMTSCSSSEEAEKVIAALRQVNRLAGEGHPFEDLFAALGSGEAREPDFPL